MARLVLVWLIMLTLLALSVGATSLPIGLWRQAISLAIATLKAALILWVFMDLRRSPGLVRLVATLALTFLAIMLTLFSADYMTRGWLG